MRLYVFGALRLLLRHTHLRGKGAVRHPLRACERCSLLKHSVDLLKCQPLGFWNQEDCVEEAEAAETAPEEKDI